MTSVATPPLDFSFCKLKNVKEMERINPRKGLKRYRKTKSGHYICHALRLNNNQLTTIEGIHSMTYQVLEKPEQLTWLDLSFNQLTSLSSELDAFPNLKILYLHGNLLQHLTSILNTLKTLRNLYSLTLHGNPVQDLRNYRCYVVSALPQLRSLDFINITEAEKKKGKQLNSKKKFKRITRKTFYTIPNGRTF